MSKGDAYVSAIVVTSAGCQDFGDSPIPTTDDPFGGSFIGVSYIVSAALENGERGTRSTLTAP